MLHTKHTNFVSEKFYFKPRVQLYLSLKAHYYPPQFHVLLGLIRVFPSLSDLKPPARGLQNVKREFTFAT